MWRYSVQSNLEPGPHGRIRRKPVGSGQYEAVFDNDEKEKPAAAIKDVSEWLMSGGSGEPPEDQAAHSMRTPATRGLVGKPPSTPSTPHKHYRPNALPERPLLQDVKEAKEPLVRYGSYSSVVTGTASQPRMWNSIWLRRIVLVGFITGFCCMTLATALLYHFSLENNGLSAQKQANHLGWKYGPTALLVVVAALWRQVDHSVKVLTPWKELKSGPSAAHKTLLLDYVSPLVPASLWRAFRNGHLVVVSTILCWLLILLTTVFSTGLLVLEPTAMVKDGVEIPIQSSFDAEGYGIPQLGPAAAQLYYAVNFQGLPYPMGTSADTVVPRIGLSEPEAQANYSVTTRGAQIGFDCETLPIQNASETSLPWYSINGMFWTINVTTPECNITSAIVAAGPNSNHYVQRNGTQNYQGRMQDYTCNNGVEYSQLGSVLANYTEEQILNVSMPHRVLLTMADLRFTPMDSRRSRPEHIYMQNLTVALCTYNYTLDDFKVQSLVDSGIRTQAVLQRVQRKGAPELEIPGLPTGMLGKSVEYAARLLDIGTGGVDFVLSTPVQSFFRLMTIKKNATTIGEFMDPDLLIAAASDVFKGIGTQLLGTTALNPALTTTGEGSVTFIEDRLHVTKLSAAMMCVFLSLLTVLSIVVAIMRPRDVVPREPGSMAATATVLASSPGLEKILLGLGSLRQRALAERLSMLKFQSIYYNGPEPAFVIESVAAEPKLTQTDGSDTPSNWWRPLAGRPWFLALAILLPLCIIAALEALQRSSDKHDGLVGIGQSDPLLFATYVPAVVAIGLAGMYSSFEAMTATFAPYSTLKKRNASPERSVTLSLVGKLAPHALLNALRTRHFNVAVILVANFVGGFLTIVISGLYSAIPIGNTRSLMLQQTDLFDLAAGNISLEDNQASAVASLIEYINLPSPKWTYEDLVFNSLQAIENPSDGRLLDEQPLSAEIPAVRANLDCSIIPSQDRHVQVFNMTSGLTVLPGMSGVYAGSPGELLLKVNTTLQSTCSQPLANATSVSKDWLQYFVVPDDGVTTHVGKASLLGWFDDSDMIAWGDGATDTSPGTGSGMGVGGIELGDSGCPSMAFTMGTIQATRTGRNETGRQFTVESDFATVVCYQRVEQVMTNVTFSAPSMLIDQLKPPIRNESTSKLLLDPKTNTTAFAYAANRLLLSISNSLFANKTESNTTASLDAFSHALLSGRDAQPLEALSGEENVDNLRKAATRLYKTYMAQAISANMRGDGDFLPAYEGTLTSSGGRRLHQNNGPKIALQAMLGVMVVCIIASRLLTTVEEVLPHDPCSIAGVATLLAGSDMVTMAEGSEWRDDGSLRSLFGGKTFGLDWWGIGANRRFGVDVESESR
ncbi:hypothetical protein ACHAQA_009653 [Verticillium albo-atrum]